MAVAVVVMTALVWAPGCRSEVSTDEAILDSVERRTIDYFWRGAEPESGMARERYHTDEPEVESDVVTSGGSGFGIMALIAGIEREYIPVDEGLARFEQIVSFLERADRFHGAAPHWWYGPTGRVKPFSPQDDGGDLVETAFLMQGLLTLRQYLIDGGEREMQLVERIDRLWYDVEWDWYCNGQQVLYWHWSPTHEWAMNFPVRGFNECLIMYILAASSPTHPVDPSVYHVGWAENGAIVDKHEVEGETLALRYQGGATGPLFWAHYSFLGLDPRGLRDRYADYGSEMRAFTLGNRAYCVRNPKGYAGYGPSCWGLTSSYSPDGYAGHAPIEDRDLGVISPTAALSSIVYTPEYSMDVMRALYTEHPELWGPYGFYDAFSPSTGWYVPRYLAIDQGPIAVMIENHRSGLLWELFMSHPDVQRGLRRLGFKSPHLEKPEAKDAYMR